MSERADYPCAKALEIVEQFRALRARNDAVTEAPSLIVASSAQATVDRRALDCRLSSLDEAMQCHAVLPRAIPVRAALSMREVGTQ
jgi:hypothetical protein